MKAIMYHYVRPDDPALPYFNRLHIENFVRQLDYFEQKFGFVTQEEFLASFETGVVPRGVILTFDDGLKDHYTFVLPELQKRGLWGIFYIPCIVLQRPVMLDVHRIHVLIGASGGERLLDAIDSTVDKSILIHEEREDFHVQTYDYHTDLEAAKQAKRILNYLLEPAKRSAVISSLFKKLDVPEETITSNFYLNSTELKQLAASGMIIGSHSVTHPVMSTLSVKEQEREVRDSFAYLNSVLGDLRVKTFCYPYGHKYSYTDDTVRILERERCLFSLDVEPRDILSVDVLDHPQTLPRYDCNQFPHGAVRGS